MIRILFQEIDLKYMRMYYSQESNLFYNQGILSKTTMEDMVKEAQKLKAEVTRKNNTVVLVINKSQP